MISAGNIRSRLIRHLALPSVPDEIESLIDQLIEECLKNIELVSDIKAVDLDELCHMACANDPVLKNLGGCRKVHLGLVSLGPASQTYFDQVQDKGSLEFYLINEIYNIILSDCFSGLWHQLKASLGDATVLDSAIAPGEGDAGLLWQKVIFQYVAHTGVSLDEKTLFMTPVKSFTFMTGERKAEEVSNPDKHLSDGYHIDIHQHLIRISINGEAYFVSNQARLFDVLVDNKIAFDGYCGGNHRCGKCLVNLIHHNQQETRLACETYCTDGMEILTLGKRHQLKVEDSYQGIRHAPSGTGCEGNFGIVFDVGTTTIVGGCFDLGSKEKIRLIAEQNDQYLYGLDVISRISYSLYNEKGLERLNRAIISQLNEMTRKLTDGLKLNITRMVIVGNPTMISIINNIPLDSLAGYPFESKVNNLIRLRASEIGLEGDADIVFPYGVSGFIGSDILSGIVACKFYETSRYQLLIDLGTNGEIALGNMEEIHACSTAAGPAFEGAKIGCGVPSIPGAICRFTFDDKHPVYETIDNVLPVGFCGSGIIDLMAALSENNIIDASGRFVNTDDFRTRLADAEFIFSQQDVRELQLAKSAIMTGMEILLKKAHITIDELGTIFISGGLGSNINVQSAIKIGLLPDGVKNKVQLIGNSSFYGASLFLLYEQYEKIFDQTKSMVRSYDLNEEEPFTDSFIRNLEIKKIIL
jgi:uncharacterized 2Fe-2S/4Fe-4S cluster protein (DUF4445 family)